MDNFWIYLSSMQSWISLYILLILLFYHIWGWEKTFIIVCFIGVLIISTYQSAALFKHLFKRYRPCYEPELAGKIICFNEMSNGLYGFFSAHSANHFGLAIFLMKLFSSVGKHINVILIIWASLVAYSRIYLAVHYPSDVFIGMLIGFIFGYFFGNIYLKILGHPS